MIGNDLNIIVTIILIMVKDERRLPVIKWVGTFWVTVRPTHPTLDGMA